MRLAAYAGTSVALAAGVVLKALHSRPNFYSVCVYFTESSAALMVLSNLVLLVIGSFLVGLQHILYGRLRPIEVEQLYEKAWFAVTETCLAMTIFREELGVWFVVMFVSLLVAKVWGWIGEGRLEILEQQPPENPRLFHARLSASLLLSMLVNAWLLNYSVDTVRQTHRPNMMVMFAFEFALLNVSSLSTLVRYGIIIQETLIVRDQTRIALQTKRKEIEDQRKLARDAAEAAGEPAPEEPPIEEVLDEADVDVPGWEEKGRYIFYLDLTTDFLRLVLYITFFCVLCRLYGMPIHIIRDVALVVRSFYRRVTDFIKYTHATRDMHARYPDATQEEISSQDVCIICREGMRARPQAAAQAQAEAAPLSPLDERLRPKKLPCGHILHFACLRSWLERQQNCPTCRQPVLSAPRQSQPVQAADQPVNGGGGGGGGGGGAGAPVAPPPPGFVQPPQANAVRPQAPNNRIRMRTFALGPLRLTLGAGRWGGVPPANIIPGQTDAPGADTAITATAATAAQQRYNIQQHINSVERRIVHEAVRLGLQHDQLSVLRAMQAELTRLRRAHRAPEAGAQTNPMGTTWTPPTNTMNTQQVSVFSTNNTNEPLHAGSTGIPPGVVLPDGWTLLPLQRLPEQQPIPQTMPMPIPMQMGMPMMGMQPQQRSRSLGPSRQTGPSSTFHPTPSNLPSVALQQPSSRPVESLFSTVPRTTTQPGPGSEEREAQAVSAPSGSVASAQQQSTSLHPSTAHETSSQLEPQPVAPTAIGASSLQPQAIEDLTSDPPNLPSSWQWPTSPQEDTPSTTTNPTTTGASASHTVTIEDAPDEED